MKRFMVVRNREILQNEGEVLCIDKPFGWSSFDVVAKLRSMLHDKKIGHTGTLDKSATGLLVVCTGRKLKEIERYQSLEKEYEVTMRLGERTESFDTETPVIETRDVGSLSPDVIYATVSKYVGPQTQLPPMWSAVKIRGARLYKLARKGINVTRRPREVCIKSINIKRLMLPDVEMTIECSKGTYIRSLVNDIGIALGVGAHVTALRRTRIGEFRISDALTIEAIARNRILCHD